MIQAIIPGDIVVAEFPIIGGHSKQRPAIVLKVVPPFDDVLVCGISRQLRHRVPELDELIVSTDDDFVASGLHSDSLIRLGYLTTLFMDEVDGAIGDVSTVRLTRLLNRLATYLVK